MQPIHQQSVTLSLDDLDPLIHLQAIHYERLWADWQWALRAARRHLQDCPACRHGDTKEKSMVAAIEMVNARYAGSLLAMLSLSMHPSKGRRLHPTG